MHVASDGIRYCCDLSNLLMHTLTFMMLHKTYMNYSVLVVRFHKHVVFLEQTSLGGNKPEWSRVCLAPQKKKVP